MNEAALVALASSGGDIAAFGSLVRLYQGRIRGFLLRMTRGDQALADDLAQETFLEAFRKIAQLQNDDRFGAWLFRIAYTRFLMIARKRNYQTEPLDPELAAEGGEAAQIARMDLESAMTRLESAQRAALTLCFAIGYSHHEAATILRLPLGTVKSHILRGQERLRGILEPKDTT